MFLFELFRFFVLLLPFEVLKRRSNDFVAQVSALEKVFRVSILFLLFSINGLKH